MTRLLAETNPSLYRHLDTLEADPSLYATPWFLTLFAANFPLGFVARVFDLIFLEGSTAPLVKIAVCLLLEMETNIKEAGNLEELMNVMKVSLPSLTSSRLEDVIRQAGSLNINRQLEVYQIEFAVLQEEQATNKCQVDKLKTEIEEKERAFEAAKIEIQNLKQRLKQSETIVNQIDNNNRVQVSTSSEDTLYRVVAAVEALSCQVPEDIRLQLENIARMGKES